MADLDLLLLKTSRTFALSIPQLPEPTRTAIGLAYLLFRIADTFEDAELWTREDRVEALDQFAALLRSPSEKAFKKIMARWSDNPPCDNESYMELLNDLPHVVDEMKSLSRKTRKVLQHHLLRTTCGMAEYVKKGEADGSLHLRDLDDLRNYCYVVAGIVGELITEVFLLHDPGLKKVSDVLNEHTRSFGEGLQLVNIIRDAKDDAKDGRVYLPPDVDIANVFEIARDSLYSAEKYVLALQKGDAPRGFVAFCALPVLLAFATLKRVEEVGAGAKITRDEVKEIVAKMNLAIDNNEPAISLD
jgi:farnesyl-diphosphate farnesyltransferase